VTLYFHPEAQEELLYSVEFYENKAEDLGAEFLDEIEQTLELIKSFPELGSPITTDDRRMLVGRFPFAIIYSVQDNDIIIYALMHLRRKPGYWKHRK